MGGLMLRPADELGLSAAEAADLAASLAALGMELYTPVPTRWYLRLPAPPDLITTPLDRVAGEYLSAHLPQGRDAGRLMARVNEAQMLLHDHPANQDRERRGLAAVNGLWLWGGGELPRPAEQSVVVASDVGQVQVLARALGAKTRPTPGNAIDLDTDPSADWLVVLTPGENDASLEELLVRLERTWFHPLLVRLRFGRVRRLALHLMARPGQSVAVDAVAAWRFWR